MLIHYIINYFSYTIPFLPLGILILLKIKKRVAVKGIYFYFLIFLTLLLGILLFYSRFVEPRSLKTNNINIETGFKSKIVLISDLHIGAYSNSKFLQKVVNEINRNKDADFVVIAGDITYYPSKDLKKLLGPLIKIEKPTYLVLGNHDSTKPGPYLQNQLNDIFKSSKLKLLKNETVYIEELNLNILGLGDLWANEAEVKKLEKFINKDNLLVIAHTPDTIFKYKTNIADLTISGHTHGGQIRIPFVYKLFIPSKYDFDQGLYNTSKGKVYVSSGIGISGLPFRLGIPPSIDIVNTF